MTRRALVLGAGGHAAIAWQTGVIAGLGESGIDLRACDLFVGTSAGAIVAVRLTAGIALEELFRAQADREADTSESAAGVDFNQWRSAFARAREGVSDRKEILKRIGVLGLTAPTEAESERRKVVASRLPAYAWPEQRLLIAAVDAETGERHAFEQADGVELIDAVSASCAVPGLRPLVTIGGRRYMDGGVYSIDNADLAAGCDRVVVVTLRARVPPVCVMPLDAAVEALRRGGSEVVVIQPDDASEAAFATVGGNVLDPNVRRPAAFAGLEQGRRLATGESPLSWPS